jgi:hypothetical protein
MNKFLLAVGLSLVLVFPAYAGGHGEHGKKIVIHKTEVTNVTNNTTEVTNVTNDTTNVMNYINEEEPWALTAGLGINALHLMKLSSDWYVGPELRVYKEFLNSDSEHGYGASAMVIFSYDKTVVDLTAKK